MSSGATNRSSHQCTCLSQLSKSQSEGTLTRCSTMPVKLRHVICDAYCVSGAPHEQQRQSSEAEAKVAETLLDEADGDWSNSGGGPVWRARHPSPPDALADDLLALPAAECTCSNLVLNREVRALALHRFLEANSVSASGAPAGPAVAVGSSGSSGGSEQQQRLEDCRQELNAGCNKVQVSVGASRKYERARSRSASGLSDEVKTPDSRSQSFFMFTSATNQRTCDSGVSAHEGISFYSSRPSERPASAYMSIASPLPGACNVERLATCDRHDSSPDPLVFHALANRNRRIIQGHESAV